MNQAMRGSRNLIKGGIWPAGRTLDMPDLDGKGDHDGKHIKFLTKRERSVKS